MQPAPPRPSSTDPTRTFPLGGSKTPAESDKDRAVVVAAGITLQGRSKPTRCALLKKESPSAIDAYSVNRLTRKDSARQCLQTAVIVVEDHWLEGGLGGSVSKRWRKSKASAFAKSGHRAAALRKAGRAAGGLLGLSAQRIAATVRPSSRPICWSSHARRFSTMMSWTASRLLPSRPSRASAAGMAHQRYVSRRDSRLRRRSSRGPSAGQSVVWIRGSRRHRCHHQTLAASRFCDSDSSANARWTACRHQTQDAGVWRVLRYIPGQSFAKMTPALASPAASLVARFHAAVSDLDHRFHFVRSGAHDFAKHIANLRTAAQQAERQMRFLKDFSPLTASIVSPAEQIPIEVPGPNRICHGDF